MNTLVLKVKINAMIKDNKNNECLKLDQYSIMLDSILPDTSEEKDY